MKNKKIIYLVLPVFLICTIFFGAQLAKASGTASLNISPKSGSYKVGQNFNVTISVNPNSETIDTVRAKLTYQSDFLQIVTFATDPLFAYQTGSNGFDNQKGTLSWGAGVPGGITTSHNFGTIVFKVIKQGASNVSMSPDSLALSSGVNKFDGQISSAVYSLLLPSATPKKSLTKTNPQPTVEQPIENNSATTEIIPQTQSASLANGVSFLTLLKKWWFVFALAILSIIILAYLFYYRSKEKVKI